MPDVIVSSTKGSKTDTAGKASCFPFMGSEVPSQVCRPREVFKADHTLKLHDDFLSVIIWGFGT